ncbi:MAG TPA: hypothetical protein DEB39_02930, partial [Planctomycetaceae bacterium]|nr:hypothetical protein [Planctomycetaceae bacterium]
MCYNFPEFSFSPLIQNSCSGAGSMNNDMKRRAFLGTIVGTLIALPIGVRYFCGKKTGLPHRNFGKELQKYLAKIDVPIRPVGGPASFALPLHPVVGDEKSYLLFAPSHLPSEISQATGGEPDAFTVREGWIYV